VAGENLLTDDQLRGAVDRNETWASRSGYVLIFGLVIEVALALKFATGCPVLDGLLSPIANALVLLGVYGEIDFAAKAARTQKTLQSRTDDKLTEALNRAAQSERELIDFRRPRRHLMTAENRALLQQRLAPFGGQEFDVGFGSGGDRQRELWRAS
jgi:hypothetical protein